MSEEKPERPKLDLAAVARQIQMIQEQLKKLKEPMKPKSVKKRPDEFDHAKGCPYARKPIKGGK